MLQLGIRRLAVRVHRFTSASRQTDSTAKHPELRQSSYRQASTGDFRSRALAAPIGTAYGLTAAFHLTPPIAGTTTEAYHILSLLVGVAQAEFSLAANRVQGRAGRVLLAI